MKVVGIGYPRTGTKTLGACFRALGFRNASWSGPVYEQFEPGNLDVVMKHAERFDSFEDLPWCSLFHEFDRWFPGSKFILTVRKNERAWFESFRKHNVRLNNKIFIPSKGPTFEKTIAIYRDHNASVRAHFRDRPEDLLELCWEQADGWNELCAFLGKPVPALPLPHVNKTPLNSSLRLFRLYLRTFLRLAD